MSTPEDDQSRVAPSVPRIAPVGTTASINEPPPSIAPEQTPTCATCGYFNDHSSPDDDQRELNGYCGYSGHVAYGAEYSGHWTHSDDWCSGWTRRTP